jgi:hypothetical protein
MRRPLVACLLLAPAVDLSPGSTVEWAWADAATAPSATDR